MKINIKATNLELTAPIREYIEEKIGGLEKFIANPEMAEWNPEIGKPTAEAFVEISRTTNHHHKGPVYRAEINVPMPGRGKVLRAESEQWDIRVAIDQMKNEIQIELKKYNQSQNAKFKRGSRFLKNLIRLSPMAWFKKEKSGRDLEEGE